MPTRPFRRVQASSEVSKVDREQQPGHMCDHRDRVHVRKVKKREAGEREGDCADDAGCGSETDVPQKLPHPRECEHIGQHQFQVEGDRQGQRRVEQQMQRMERADLSFRMDVEPAEQLRRPQNGVSAFQCALIEIPQWQVKGGEIVQRENASARQRHQQRDEQKQGGDDHGLGETAIERLVADARCLRSFECRQAAPRRQTARIDLPRRWPRRRSMRRETGMHQRSQSVTCATVGDDDRRSTRFPRLNQSPALSRYRISTSVVPAGVREVRLRRS